MSGKIYAIVSDSTDDIYIGSTYSTLTRRMNQHLASYRLYQKEGRLYTTSFDILKYPDAEIVLVEESETITPDELKRREGEVMFECLNCINRRVPGKSKDQLRRDKNARTVRSRCGNPEWNAYQREYRLKKRLEKKSPSQTENVQPSRDAQGAKRVEEGEQGTPTGL